MATLLLGRICRTCLLESPAMHKLLDVKERTLLEILVNNFDFGFDDVPLPVEICGDCLEKLVISYNFQQMCVTNNERLRNIMAHEEEVLLGSDVDLAVVDLLKNEDIGDEEVFKSDPEDEIMEYNVHEDFEDIQTSSPKHELITVTEIDQNSDDIKLETETIEHSLELVNHFAVDSDDWHSEGCNQSDSDYLEDESIKANVKSNTKRKYTKRKTKDDIKTCLECNKTFKKRMFLSRHMSVHDPNNQFACETCKYRFATEKLLKLHISYKHNPGENISVAGGPYQCADCPMIFEQTRALAAHRVIHAERDFKCKVCDVNLKTLSAVTRHMNHKHPGILPYKCEICDEAFPVETHFNDHINMHKGLKKHKCESCDKSFPNSTALKDHMRSHTGESPYLCPHCGKSFKTSNILRQHLQRHGDKNFQCPECPMRFYVKVNLQKHMCTHSKEKPFVCDVCGSSFTRGDSLKMHKFKHSGERPFKCEECNMSFVFKRHLIRHKITHTGEKPHMCTYCDRAYAASGDLVKHLRIHLGENTYFCDECPQTFKYQHDLRDHKNQHYKKKTLGSSAEEVVIETAES